MYAHEPYINTKKLCVFVYTHPIVIYIWSICMYVWCVCVCMRAFGSCKPCDMNHSHVRHDSSYFDCCSHSPCMCACDTTHPRILCVYVWVYVCLRACVHVRVCCAGYARQDSFQYVAMHTKVKELHSFSI